MPKCPKCGSAEKPLDEFYIIKGKKDSYCKVHRRAATKEYNYRRTLTYVQRNAAVARTQRYYLRKYGLLYKPWSERSPTEKAQHRARYSVSSQKVD